MEKEIMNRDEFFELFAKYGYSIPTLLLVGKEDSDIIKAMKKFLDTEKATNKNEQVWHKVKQIRGITEGGEGSGNYGHAGRPGEVGGSSASGGGEKGAVFSGKPANPNGVDTFEKYTNKQGNFTSERQALHEKIRQKLFEGKTPVKQPVAYLTGGGSASGKTTLISENKELGIPENLVKVDADLIKTELPEYIQKLKAKDLNASLFVHEESSYLSKKIAREAGKGKYNILLDGTGDGNINDLEKKINSMRAGGRKIIGIYATVPISVAITRNLVRAEKTGRYVPESVIREIHRGVSKVLPQAIKRGLFDEFSVWDTRVSPSVKIASGKKGKLSVHHKKWWGEFLAKGEG